MKKKLLVLLSLIGVLSLVGCEASTSMSGTYKVLGENIKVTLDTSDGYSLGIRDNYFEVKDGENTIAGGIFIDEDTYDDFYETITESLDYSVTDIGNTTQIYYVAEDEYNNLVSLDGCNAYIVVSCLSESDAKSVMSKLTFEEVD